MADNTHWMRSVEVPDVAHFTGTEESHYAWLIGRLQEEVMDTGRVIWPTVLFKRISLFNRASTLVTINCQLAPRDGVPRHTA